MLRWPNTWLSTIWHFISANNSYKPDLVKLDSLNECLQSDKPLTISLPSVAYCSGQLNLSANYFRDLIKKETGKTAQEYIQPKLILVAKERLFEQKFISQVAYELGFKYPQHFTRLFKQ